MDGKIRLADVSCSLRSNFRDRYEVISEKGKGKTIPVQTWTGS